MASTRAPRLAEAMAALRLSPSSRAALAARPPAAGWAATRHMATATAPAPAPATAHAILQSWKPVSTVPVTVHAFPSLEPVALEHHAVTHLHLPLRRDLLHAAVVHEASHARQGTASSKTRFDVHGSHRKMRPQKGTGRARLGTRQSPLLRGGGKTFGPHPRDFGTALNRKVYDKAWRIALSYRYRRGELLVCEDGLAALPLPPDLALAERALRSSLAAGLREAYLAKYMAAVLARLGLGRADGRTLFVTSAAAAAGPLHEAMGQVPWEGRVLGLDDVDVKDLLETGRVVMERSALREMLERHQSDLVSRVPSSAPSCASMMMM